MGVTSFIHEVRTRLADRLAMRRMAEFSCGNCERSEQCGLPPSDHCVIRLEQIAREDRELRRRARAVNPW